LWAIGCVRGDIRAASERWKWDVMKQRREDRTVYVNLYSKLKIKKKLDKVEQETLTKLEEKLRFEDIL
jgi:hypothetical protein